MPTQPEWAHCEWAQKGTISSPSTCSLWTKPHIYLGLLHYSLYVLYTRVEWLGMSRSSRSLWGGCTVRWAAVSAVVVVVVVAKFVIPHGGLRPMLWLPRWPSSLQRSLPCVVGLSFWLSSNPQISCVASMLRFFLLALLHADTSDCLLFFLPHPLIGRLYFYDPIWLTRSYLVASRLVWYISGVVIRSLMYDTYLRATHTTTSSIRGVQIPIYLVSDATDSLQWSVAVLKLYQ